MTVAIVHLSDIHFKATQSQICTRFAKLAEAVCSSDPQIESFIIVVSGDVGWSGANEEYLTALDFFRQFKSALEGLRRGSSVEIVCVPGNHDCSLPTADAALRSALISGFKSHIQTATPDASLLASVLAPQQNYWEFYSQLEPQSFSSEEKVFQVRSFKIEGSYSFHFLLFNTALLSRRAEAQGELDIPLPLVRQMLPPSEPNGVYVSVFHHSYGWLQADTGVEFRAIIEQVSDFALSGHQHFQHKTSESHDAGTLTWIEAGALQDEDYNSKSQFGVILFNCERKEQRILAYKWVTDLYKNVNDSGWRPRTFNNHSRPRFVASKEITSKLSDPGIPKVGTTAGFLKLQDIFVPPELSVKAPDAKPTTIPGEEAVGYLLAVEYGLCIGQLRAGKSALAASLFFAALSSQSTVPLIISGRLIVSSEPGDIDLLIKRQFTDQYDESSYEKYLQLPRDQRRIIIDDWHLTDLEKSARTSFVDYVRKLMGFAILFCDDIFRFEDAAAGFDSDSGLMDSLDISIKPFGHVARGKLVDKWIKLQGSKVGKSQREVQRSIEDMDRLLLSVMGRNTLPSLPFIIICILKAHESESSSVPEAGSFGYLYEVLVTTALNYSSAKETQLDKKFTILSSLAYELMRSGDESVSRDSFRRQIEEYSNAYKIKVNAEDIINDLLEARVLTDRDTNLYFTYPHYYYYFVARYFRDLLRARQEGDVRNKVNHMIDNVGIEENAAIIMFLMYFTKDTNILSRLIGNADRIYAATPLCRLEEDTYFVSELDADSAFVDIPTSTNLDENRRKRRKLRDEAQETYSGTVSSISAYADDLSDIQKIRLAFRHLELLGQVIRNFPGSLPGEEKLLVLDASYRLGLRLLSALMGLLREGLALSKARLAEVTAQASAEDRGSAEEFIEEMEQFTRMVAELSSFAVVKKLSSCLGLADLEGAYAEAAKMVGETSATKLVNFGIRLDHISGFPIAELRRLLKELRENELALNTLRLLVFEYMVVFGFENHRTRQSVSSLIRVQSNSPKIVGKSDRRF